MTTPTFDARDLTGIIRTLADVADGGELSERQEELIEAARVFRDSNAELTA